MKILVTNDDGYHSPLLEPLLNGLKSSPWCTSLRTVVPAENQSWISQAHSRKGALSTYEVPLGSHQVIALNGTPADCVAVGADPDLGERPDLVISGINIGINAGSCFLFSSGTVGGGWSAAQYGVKGIALSAHIPREIFNLWNTREYGRLSEHQSDWTRIGMVFCNLVGQLLEQYRASDIDLLTINAPWNVSDQTPVRGTFVERALLGGLFRRSEDGRYRHALGSITRTEQVTEGELEADFRVIERGEISLTALKLKLGEALPEGFISSVNGHRVLLG